MTNEPQVALVTGASSGIGKATAVRLLSDGWHVIALARRADRLRDLAAGAPVPGRIRTLVVDVADRAAVRAALTALPAPFATIDALVNNAGLALGLDASATAEVSDWDTMLDVNCRALVWLTRELLPGMLERRRGHIINIGSIAGIYPYRGSNVYGATKAFVGQFTLNLRADLLGSPVRATLIEPGMVGDSEFSDVRFHGDSDKARAVYAGTRPLMPTDVADAIAWAIGQPDHVNINRIELMPVCQAADQIGVKRERQPN